MSTSSCASIPTQPELDKILNSGINHRIENDPLEVWDKTVFINELLKQGIALGTDKNGSLDGELVANKGLEKGSYQGTRLALTEIYGILEEADISPFDSRGFEPIYPTQRDLEVKKNIYQGSDGTDGYPPHLKVQNNDEDNLPADERQNLPWKPRSEKVGVIFNLQETEFVQRIAQVVSLSLRLSSTKVILTRGLRADVEKYNKGNLPKLETASKNGVVLNQDSEKKGHKSKNADIMKGRNISEHDGWYPDARFAQQHLIRVNPSTIETAPAEKVKAFIVEAEKQGLEQVKKLLEDGQNLFIQDYSYFHKTTGIKDDQIFQNRILELDDKQKPTGKFVSRYAATSIVVFQLHQDGRLHPIVITLDYRGSLDNSITIFNRRLTPDDKGNIDEKHNWPWRYAKTVAQTADWA